MVLIYENKIIDKFTQRLPVFSSFKHERRDLSYADTLFPLAKIEAKV